MNETLLLTRPLLCIFMYVCPKWRHTTSTNRIYIISNVLAVCCSEWEQLSLAGEEGQVCRSVGWIVGSGDR